MIIGPQPGVNPICLGCGQDVSEFKTTLTLEDYEKGEKRLFCIADYMLWYMQSLMQKPPKKKTKF